MSRRARPDRLEAHYRRLLAVYPPRHRARYGEEMIGVLMASSAPGQRRPNLRESLDLVLSGVRARLNAGTGGDLSPAGRAAARIFGFLASVVLAALSWYEVAARIAWSELSPLGNPIPHPWLAQVPYRALVMGAGWTLVACACAAGLRRIAALGAVSGFLGYAAVVGRGYDFAPDSLVSSWWLLTLTAFTAGCLVSLVRSAPAVNEAQGKDGESSTVHDPSTGARDGRLPDASGWRGVLRRDSDRLRPLGWRAVVALTAGAAVTVGAPFLARALAVVEPEGNGAWELRTRGNLWLPVFGNPYDHGPLRAVLLVVVLVVIVLRLGPAVRRRVLLLSAPVAGTVLLVQAAFQGFVNSGSRFTVYLTIGQWGALVLVPLLVFAIGAWLLHRYEQKLASGALLT